MARVQPEELSSPRWTRLDDDDRAEERCARACLAEYARGSSLPNFRSPNSRFALEKERDAAHARKFRARECRLRSACVSRFRGFNGSLLAREYL